MVRKKSLDHSPLNTPFTWFNFTISLMTLPLPSTQSSGEGSGTEDCGESIAGNLQYFSCFPPSPVWSLHGPHFFQQLLTQTISSSSPPWQGTAEPRHQGGGALGKMYWRKVGKYHWGRTKGQKETAEGTTRGGKKEGRRCSRWRRRDSPEAHGGTMVSRYALCSLWTTIHCSMCVSAERSLACGTSHCRMGKAWTKKLWKSVLMDLLQSFFACTPHSSLSGT